MKISSHVKKLLLEKGFDKQFGARPLRRVIQSKVQTPVAKFLLQHERPVMIDATVHEDQVVIDHKEAPVG